MRFYGHSYMAREKILTMLGVGSFSPSPRAPHIPTPQYSQDSPRVCSHTNIIAYIMCSSYLSKEAKQTV